MVMKDHVGTWHTPLKNGQDMDKQREVAKILPINSSTKKLSPGNEYGIVEMRIYLKGQGIMERYEVKF